MTQCAYFTNYYKGWHGWLVRKAVASHQGDPGSIPGRAIVELCVGSLLCHKVFQTIRFSSLRKNSNTFDLGCALWS